MNDNDILKLLQETFPDFEINSFKTLTKFENFYSIEMFYYSPLFMTKGLKTKYLRTVICDKAEMEYHINEFENDERYAKVYEFLQTLLKLEKI